MTPWLQDPDVTLYHGDVLEVLRELPAESVDCVVTSPPYWGLRDYGTGEWEGGDAEHAHATIPARNGRGGSGTPGKQTEGVFPSEYAASECSCGATRIDKQLGLEPTPEQYVEKMVEVFREVRRVLAAHGTVWLNLGDSYASSTANGGQSDFSTSGLKRDGRDEAGRVRTLTQNAKELRRQQPAQKLNTGLKPKDLVGIPWRVAFALQADGWYLRSDIIEEVELFCPCGCGYVLEERVWRWSQDRDLIWKKPNPMPESVTDRPTKSHEYIFLLSKQPRYFFDQEAVREKVTTLDWKPATGQNNGHPNYSRSGGGQLGDPSGRNIRSVWEIATQPYPEAHFATFPEELARRAILAGTPEAVCRVCGKARERIVEREPFRTQNSSDAIPSEYERSGRALRGPSDAEPRGAGFGVNVTTLGFTDCGHAYAACTACDTVLDRDDLSITTAEAMSDMRDDVRPEATPSERDVLLGRVREFGEAHSAGTALQGVPGDVSSREEHRQVLLAGLCEQMDDKTSRERKRLVSDDEGLHPGVQARSSQREQDGLRDAASPSDGGSTRPTTDFARGRPSSEWRQGGQSAGESRGRDEAGSRSDAETSCEADRLSALRRNDHYVGSCPACSGSLRLRSDGERFRPGVVCDPFVGSGTVAHVARKLGRHAVGIDLSEEYLELAARRLQQQSLFAEMA